jgi:hypothetical protein
MKKGIILTNSQQKTLCLFSNLMQYLPVVAVVKHTGVLSNRGELEGRVLLMMATTCRKREKKTKQLAGGDNGGRQTREFRLAQPWLSWLRGVKTGSQNQLNFWLWPYVAQLS